MANGDKDYFLDRAEAELEWAQRSTHAAAVRAHYLLAGYYLDRVYGENGDAGSLADDAGEAQ